MDQELDVGARLGRYRVDALVGEGGMGRVWRAYDEKLQRHVALKLLHRGEQDILAEARVAATLEHSGVVAIFDVVDDERVPFIVMEFVDGRSLRALIEAGEGSPRERLRWLRDVAAALGAAHDKGFVHRDIKPENVMLRDDGVIKLLDFGIARRLTHAHEDGGRPAALATGSTLTGTPRYMAPEQIQRRSIDARTDQFAWGVLAHELLTGAPPWRDGPGLPVNVAIVTRPAPRLPANLGLPAPLDALLAHTLSKQPSARFESMAEVVAQLDALLASWPDATEHPPTRASSPSPTATERTEATQITSTRPQSMPRRRRRAALISLVGLTGLALASLLTLHDREAHELELDPTTHDTAAHTEPLDDAEPPPTWSPGPEAAAAYAEARRRLFGAALSAAFDDLAHAVELEPEFAAAHLRIGVIALFDGAWPLDRDPFLAATRLREHLDTKDRALLDAFEPAYAREPADIVALERGLAALEQRWPDDREIALLRSIALVAFDRGAQTLAQIERLAQDPRAPMATAELGLAYIHGSADRLDAAADALERCLALAPDAVDCVWYRTKLDAHLGRCEDMEAGGRQWMALEHVDHGAHTVVLRALIAQSVPAAELDEARREAAEHMTLELWAITEHFIDASLAVLAGEFETAEHELVELPRLANLDSRTRVSLAELRVALHEELGHVDEAAAIATELLQRRAVLPAASYDSEDEILLDPTMRFESVRLAAGMIDRPTFIRAREAWFRAWRERSVEAMNEDALWLRGYAEPAHTVADAHEALTALGPGMSPPRFVPDQLLIVDSARVYLLADQVERAVELLREATASCLASNDPLRFVQAHALLGQGLEALGDREGACAAYAFVDARWGRVEGSRTAALARARMDALDCRA